MRHKIPAAAGGFGEGKKCIADKAIAETHQIATFKIRERINNNIRRFKIQMGQYESTAPRR